MKCVLYFPFVLTAHDNMAIQSNPTPISIRVLDYIYNILTSVQYGVPYTVCQRYNVYFYTNSIRIANSCLVARLFLTHPHYKEKGDCLFQLENLLAHQNNRDFFSQFIQLRENRAHWRFTQECKHTFIAVNEAIDQDNALGTKEYNLELVTR